MKNLQKFSCLLSLVLLWSCGDKEDVSPDVITVDDYQQVSVAGNIILRFKQDESNTENQNEVHIVTKGYGEQLIIRSENGELRIVGDDLTLNEAVVVEIYPGTLEAIRLESGQKAVFDGVIISQL